jgi:putative ABC transport system permease protein
MLSLRTLLRNPIQFAIMILGIALGVAVMVSIDLANASAARAFDLSTSAITGRTTHSIVAGDQGVDESLYVQLRTDPQWRNQLESAPLVITQVVSPQVGNVPFTLLGIDPFAEAPFRSYLVGGNQIDTETITSLLTIPGSILLSASIAQQYGLHPCSPATLNVSCSVKLSVNGEMQDAYITGLLEPSDDFARRALNTLILTDISTAQNWSNMQGKLTQIDLILPDDFHSAALSKVVPPGTLLVASELRNSQVTEMTAAFQTNLTALSLLALLVGVFLIYNAMTFSVLHRRSLFGTLRSIGYTREQVFSMVLGEAALVGIFGVALGLGVGILLGQGAVRMVTQTINDLYFVVNVRGIQIPASSLLKGALAGFFASVFAAAPPAWEAASVPPRLALSRAGLEKKAQFVVNRVVVLGVVTALLGALILVVPTRDLIISFAGTTAIVIGLAALTPWVTTTLMRLLGEPLGKLFGWLGRLAPRNVIRSQSRTAVAVAALMISVSVTIGVQVMIASFRTTVVIWLEETMRGDVYVSTQGMSASRLVAPLDPQVIALLHEHPSIQSSIAVRVATVESRQGPVEIVATSPDRPINPQLYLSAQGNLEEAWQMVREGGILLSEPLANRLDISAPRGTLALLTPRGWQLFPIAGIYSDYASTRGTVRMSLDVYRRLWNDNRLDGLALILFPGADADAVTTELRLQLNDFPNIQINPSSALRQDALDVFDRTFAITTAMQLITTLVAFIGVLSSLLAVQLEKAREMGILRALGLTVAEMRRLTLLETGLLGASAGLLSLPTGYIMAWILIFIINQRSFGWTLQLHISAAPFVQAFLLAVSAALLAALYPIWRQGSMQVAEALRGE